MTSNLLDTAKGYLTDAVVSRLSGSLDENPEDIQKALAGALPLFVNGLISRSSDPGLLTDLTGRFMTDSTTADPNDPDTLMSKGSGLAEAIFGTGSGVIGDALAQFSGVKPTSAAGLLSVAGSVITGLLGRQLLSEGGGITAGSLMQLLNDQRGTVAPTMPSGLSALLDKDPKVEALGNSSSTQSTVAGATGATPSTLDGAKTSHTPAYSDTVNDRPNKSIFWLLAALTFGLMFFAIRGCSDNAETITDTDDTTSASMPDATANLDSVAAGARAGALLDTAGNAMALAIARADTASANAIAALGAFGTRKLPDGIELNIPANGIENKLIAFIEDPAKPVDKTTWFNFDRLRYETGSATLKPESREQLQNMAAILKAYPVVMLKVGGYTDNTGQAAANQTLSQSRAEAAVAELVRLGVGQARLEAEGYGQAFPVASNKTEEGRTQNRRTAVRVTKK